MKIGVTGPNGKLARELINSFGCLPLECDVSDYDALRIELERVSPDIVIHAAAYTDVDGAEKHNDKAIISNVRGSGNLGILFKGKIAYLSTSYVFDGRSEKSYSEQDVPNPLGNYAWSKHGGEQALTTFSVGNSDRLLIVRTISLYGPEGDDFVSIVASKFEAGEEFSLPDDLKSNPTYIPHLAEGVIKAIERNLSGVLNIAGREVVSRYVWGLEIAKTFRYKSKLLEPSFAKQELVEGVAPRPLMGGLSVNLAQKGRIPIYSFRQGMKALRNARR